MFRKNSITCLISTHNRSKYSLILYTIRNKGNIGYRYKGNTYICIPTWLFNEISSFKQYINWFMFLSDFISKFCETLVPILSSAQKCTGNVSNRKIIIKKKRLKKIKIRICVKWITLKNMYMYILQPHGV